MTLIAAVCTRWPTGQIRTVLSAAPIRQPAGQTLSHYLSVAMARASKLRFVGVVERHHDAVGAISSAGDFACVTRGKPRAIVMMCPDGCGELLTVNIDARSGKAWRADMRRDELSLYPSVWRDDGCGAHFVVWSNNVYWCDIGFRRPEIPS